MTGAAEELADTLATAGVPEVLGLDIVDEMTELLEMTATGVAEVEDDVDETEDDEEVEVEEIQELIELEEDVELEEVMEIEEVVEIEDVVEMDEVVELAVDVVFE
jgi:S-DNA-T family DNA segregation ATPase FtsK/SpoIIIE